MWNAIKGDLLEFVNVIQTDVAQKLESNNDCSSNSNFASSEHVNKLGNVNSRDIEKLSNSRETFTEDVHHHDYDEFKSQFHLDDYAFDITRLLNGSHNVFGDMDSIQPSDIPEIAKYFEELVPFQMSKEEFWSRYYFRVHKLNSDSTYMKMGNKSEEEEDDENIPWDIEEDTNPSSRAVGDDEEAFSEKHTVRQNEAAEDISNGEEMNNSMLGMTMLNINAYDYNSLVHENSKLKASNSELKDRVRSLESELITTKVEYELMIKALQDKLESSLKTDPSPSNVSSSVSHTSTSNSSAMPTESDSAITQSTSCGESVASPEPISTVAPTAVYDGTVKYIADEDVETTQSIASTNQSTSSLVYVPSDIPLVSGSVVEKTCLSDEEDEESWD